LRPILLMAAAFVPAIVGSVDPTKLPPPEIVTKHLSPIVSSQRYDRDGYMADSIGPITLDQSAIGLAILSSLGAGTRPKAGAAATGRPPSPSAPPQPTLSAAPTPWWGEDSCGGRRVACRILECSRHGCRCRKAPAAPFRHYSLLWRKAEENCCRL